jgi:hypothetical protein
VHRIVPSSRLQADETLHVGTPVLLLPETLRPQYPTRKRRMIQFAHFHPFPVWLLSYDRVRWVLHRYLQLPTRVQLGQRVLYNMCFLKLFL